MWARLKFIIAASPLDLSLKSDHFPFTQSKDTAMDTTATTDKFAKQSHSAVDNAADKIHDGIRGAQRTVRQGLKSVNAASRRISDTASQVSDTVSSYTKKNPVKALLIAAASGALLLTVIKTLVPSRD